MKYKIKEIFGPTIQGEGSYAGHCVMFVRFTGCNKWSGRPQDKPKSICHFCDTDFVGGELFTASEIVKELNKLSNKVKTVVLSGGEPLLQVDKELILELKRNYFKVHIETNGSIEIKDDLRYYIDHITMSPKQSPEDTKLKHCNDLKILHPSINDKITIEEFKNFDADNFFLQPVMSDNYESNLKETIEKIYEYPNVKLSLQVHKIIEVQ